MPAANADTAFQRRVSWTDSTNPRTSISTITLTDTSWDLATGLNRAGTGTSDLTAKSGDGVGLPSGQTTYGSGDADAANDTGDVVVTSGDATGTGDSGDLFLGVGSSTGGAAGMVRHIGAVGVGGAVTTVTIGDPSIPVDAEYTQVDSSGGAFAPVMPVGKAAGQKITLAMTVAGAAATLTTRINGTSLVLDAVGEGAELRWDGTGWTVTGTTGTYTP